jgi:hypothetical protein
LFQQGSSQSGPYLVSLVPQPISIQSKTGAPFRQMTVSSMGGASLLLPTGIPVWFTAKLIEQKVVQLAEHTKRAGKYAAAAAAFFFEFFVQVQKPSRQCAKKKKTTEAAVFFSWKAT